MKGLISPVKKYAKINPTGSSPSPGPAHSNSSSSLEHMHEHIVLSNYVTKDVDPLLKECIIFLLCNKPRDVLDIMIAYFTHQFNQQIDSTITEPYALPEGTVISTESQKPYFRACINPLLRKLLREVSIHKPNPKNIVGFLCDELVKIQKGESSVEVDKKIRFHVKPCRTDNARPSTTDGNFSVRQLSRVEDTLEPRGVGLPEDAAVNIDNGSIGSRPKTTGRFVAVPDFVDPIVSSDGCIEDPIFLGGQLQLQILHAEKYSGLGGVFGNGRFKSFVQIKCGDKILKESDITSGSLDDDGKWAGYDSDLGVVILTPEMGSAVNIVVFDCDREMVNKPLGTAKLIMDTITKHAKFECILPIENNNHTSSSSMNALDPNNLEGDSLDIDSLVSEGQITLSVDYKPFQEYPIEHLAEDRMDVTFIQSLGMGIGWEPKDNKDGINIDTARRYVNSRFSAALCMFDAEGHFLDGVDGLQKYSRKGPPTYYQRILGSPNSGKDIDDITVNMKHKSQRYDTSKCFIYFILLIAKDGASFKELESTYVRIKDGKSKVPYGRYDFDVNKALKEAKNKTGEPSAVILARVWRDFNDAGVIMCNC